MEDSIESDIIIIGAGLTGLAIAHFLRNKNLNITVLESRDRVGGRIHTVLREGSPPIELGATWLGKQHTALFKLLKELKIDVFEQLLGEYAIYEPISTSPPQIVQLPPNNDPSFRIRGGTNKLISSLTSSLEQAQILLDQNVSKITLVGDRLEVQTNHQLFEASRVISTLPPHLFVNNIRVNPVLPTEVIEVANNTHTWMGDSIKIALSYANPFWKEDGSSGTIFSNVGPIPEMYDHSDFEESQFALIGFLNGSYYSVSKEERLELILTQLEKYYGSRALTYLNYDETAWRNEVFTSTEYKNHVLPHQNNSHPCYQQKYLDNRLFLAGTETSPEFGGYMEGAIRSAQLVGKYVQHEL